MPEFKEAMPHGELREVLPEIFFVTGTTRPNFEGGQWQFSRNMIVVRDGEQLTLVNTVRLDPSGLAALEALGTVTHIVKLGAFHGMDDAFYRDRYQAKQWALEGMTHEAGHQTDHVLKPGGEMPFAGCDLFVFETSKAPEGLLLLDTDQGTLISCDSLQNWAEVDQYFDDETAERMTAIGFIKPANLGPGWLRFSEPKASDFERVKALKFRNLLPAHGTPLLEDAHAQFSATFDAFAAQTS